MASLLGLEAIVIGNFLWWLVHVLNLEGGQADLLMVRLNAGLLLSLLGHGGRLYLHVT